MRTQSTIRYAIIGAGMMGQEHISNIALLHDASISVIIDPDRAMRESATRLAHEHGFTSVLVSESLSELTVDRLRDLCDCAVVVSPNYTHANILKMLLPTDIPLLVEKPLITDTADLPELQMLAEGRNAPVWVAMEYRYMPPTTKFIQALADGAVGELKMLTIREHRYPFLEKVNDWNRFANNTGGTMVEKCCHYFDLMCLITNSHPVRIFASGAADVNHQQERYDGRVPDIIDNAFAIVDFATGVRCALDLCMFAEGSDPQESITALGDGGKLEVRIPGPDRFWPDMPARQSELIFMSREPRAPRIESVKIDEALLAAGDHHGATFYQHQRFADLVRHGGMPEVTFSDGARAVIMGAAAEESIRTGQSVLLGEIVA